MIKADYHLHTSFSGDSETPMKDMIEQGIALGLETICFTEHFDYDFPYYKPEETGMFDLDVDSYLAAVENYQKEYNKKIKILHGVELGAQPHIGEYLNNYVSSHPFDFVISSSHVSGKIDPYYPVFFEGRTPKEAITSYFMEIRENLNHFTNFDSYGHLDYVLRYVPGIAQQYKHQDYIDIYTDILTKIISMGKGIEINSGGHRTSLARTNPSIELIKLYHSLGGEIITVGSDAHKPEHMAWEFKKSEEILKECGFKYYTIFENRKPIFIKID